MRAAARRSSHQWAPMSEVRCLMIHRGETGPAGTAAVIVALCDLLIEKIVSELKMAGDHRAVGMITVKFS